MQTGSYSAVAAWLTLHFGAEPPVSRQQVHLWYTRGTLNRAGQPFPRPVAEHPDAKRTQPRLEFSIPAVIDWAMAGVPALHGDGWRQLGE